MTAHPLRIEAYLPVAFDQTLPAVLRRAREIGFPLQERPRGLSVTMSGGWLEVDAAAEGTRLQVTSEDAGHLQMLRDYLTDELAAAGLTPEWRGLRASRHPANQAAARVVSVETLSPAYRRVTLDGAELARFATGGLHFRLLFGPAGAARPVTNENGVTEWPGGTAAWHKPVYTTRNITLAGDNTRLSFDIFVHEGGRTSAWSVDLAPGDAVLLAGPGGDKGPRAASWQGFVGDETAVPVIARHLRMLPPETRGEAVLVVPSEADIQTLDHPAGVAIRWALRSAGATPLEALADLDIPPTDRAIFFAAEMAEAQTARQMLAERGLDKAEFTAAGYWNATEVAG